MDDRSSTLSPTPPRTGVNPAAPYAASHSSTQSAPYDASHAAPDTTYSPKSLGPKYPPHTMNGPLFEGIDMAGLAAAIVITLGPLAAYSLGWGA
jgi:hypothetical protein